MSLELKRWLCVALVVLLLGQLGCSAKFVPYDPPKIEFVPIAYYDGPDLDSIPKPERIQPIWVNKDFEEVADPKDAAYVLLAPAEYAKVGMLVKLAATYKQIIQEQTSMVNRQIDVSNSLQEIVAMEQLKGQITREQWASSENAYREEHSQRRLDNVIKDAMIGLLIIGGIVIGIVAL